jgi:exopolysaccharide biosynthesis polyprenyl glycosylphosphotransferase
MTAVHWNSRSATACSDAELSDEARPRRSARPSAAKSRRRVPAALVVDVLALTAAVAVVEIGAGRADVAPLGHAWAIAFLALVLACLAVRRSYQRRPAVRTLDDVRVVVISTALAAMAFVTVRLFVGSGATALADQTARLWLFATLYVLGGRLLLDSIRRDRRVHGAGGRRTLIIGAGRVGRSLAKRLRAQPELGLLPVGYLDRDPLPASRDDLGVLGASWDLEQVVRDHRIEHVIVAFSNAPGHVFVDLMRRCDSLDVSVSMVPRLYEHVYGQLSVEHLGGIPLLSATPPNPRGAQYAIKYAIDRIAAAALLVLTLPVFAASAVAVWCSLGRPIFFGQRRVGVDGKPFRMLKFRTMAGSPEVRGEADEDWAEQQLHGTATSATSLDERLTRVGRFLRKSSLDELPQLLNVLRGEMSMVGPRPERVNYVARFEQSVYRYGDRHRVKSGITGWAQVNGLRGRTSLADRVEWDNYYIENFSLWLDVKILLLTTRAVLADFRGTGRRSSGKAAVPLRPDALGEDLPELELAVTQQLRRTSGGSDAAVQATPTA